MKVVSVTEMRRAERACAASGISMDILMENAGKAVADEVGRIAGGVAGKNILLFIGPGNNGGDGLVAARHLLDSGALVSLFVPERKAGDEKLIEAADKGICLLDKTEALENHLASADIVIDAFFGTGKSRPLGGVYKTALETAARARRNSPKLKVIALDVPSGLDADTGACDAACLQADYTVTLGFPKRGLLNPPGAGHAGRISIVDIGIPDSTVADVKTELITQTWARPALPERRLDVNKGDFGRVLVIAGSQNYTGAAYLACTGAMRIGAGLVTLAIAASLDPILAAKLTEATHLPLPESVLGIVSSEASRVIFSALPGYRAMLIGSGLGHSDAAINLVRRVVLQPETALPGLVLDADALNALAKTPAWWQKLEAQAVLTPHPGEMARLTGVTVEDVQKDRTGAAASAASLWGQTVVLKGAYTVITSPEGGVRICPFANPGLATAGTGDVLAGAIAGLMAQGLSSFDAACLGVFLHALAGEMAREEMGDAGILAGDLPPLLPKAIKRLKGD